MELLRINDRKLKITLTAEDMSVFSLTCDKIDYDNTETRRAFWSILDEAKHKTGFDAAQDKVYVQIYPSRSGGCEMYVTKLTGEKKNTAPISFCKDPLFTEKVLFRFDRLEDMLSACACLTECGFASESSAYAETQSYYLFLGKDAEQDFKPTHSAERQLGATAQDLVAEFGIRIDRSMEGWLAEHGECICPERAVERYAALCASGRKF